MLIEKITLDMLTNDNVSVKTQQYVLMNGIEYPIGQPHRKSYANSERGRQEVREELPQEFQNAIFAIWGDTQTVIEED